MHFAGRDKDAVTMPEHTREHGPKLRAKYHSWGKHPTDAPVFRNVVTLDPIGTGYAWSKLAMFTPALEFQELPLRLHNSLKKAILDSKVLAQQTAPKRYVKSMDEDQLYVLRSAGL